MADAKGFDLAAMLQDASKLDTGREQIEYISIDLIDDDPNNFYQLSRVEELAANIELLGLQQPIRVRDNPEQPGRVIIVSGHRRRAALQLLVDEGKKRFRDVPCIREKEAGSAALQELRLIYANADTRTMTSAEISKQVERVETLLYQLKEEGMEFPGRMRDHVAEACKVSQSKLARLKVIREKLAPCWTMLYEGNQINESAAYALAQMAAVYQQIIYEEKAGVRKHIYEGYIKNCAKTYSEMEKLTCPKGGRCDNVNKLGHIARRTEIYVTTGCGKCCATCYDLATCKDACPKLAGQIKALKDERKWQRQQERQAKEERERPTIESITRLWQRFGEARAAAGLSVEAYHKGIEMYHSKTDDTEYPELESGDAKISTTTTLPFGYGMSVATIQRLVDVADALGCSLDYLLCRTDDPRGSGQTAAPAWRSGEDAPEPGQEAVAKFRVEGMERPMRQIAEWDGWRWRFPRQGATIDAQCIAWFPLPKEDEK